MQVDDALIDKLARLSMLSFSPEEKESIRHDLEKMIGFIGQLQDLDTTGVPPLLHMTSGQNLLRADQPGPMLTPEEALRNAPQHDGQYFVVPKAI